MRLTIAKDKLVTALERCRRVADSRSTMPILGHVMIGAGKAATFAATDLYLSTQTIVELSTEATGGADGYALPARDLLDRVKMMPAGEITIAVADDCSATISVSGSKRRFKLHALPGAEFPEIKAAGAPSHMVPAATLRDLFGKTAHAISTDETRLHLNSLLVEFSETGLRCVATDGHRLATAAIAGTDWKPLRMLVPLKGVTELRRMVDGAGDDDLALSVDGGTLFLRHESHTVSVKLVDAQFPPWEQVVPKSSEGSAVVMLAPFADAVRAVSLSASDRTGGVVLTLGDGAIKIAAESAEAGEGSDEVQAYTTREQKIGVNARYVLDVCSALECDEIEIGYSGELDPVTINPVGGGDSQFVIMPMRT